MTDRRSWRDGLCRREDRVGVDSVVPVQIGERARLTEMLDPERTNAMAVDRAEPRQRRGMTVENSHDAAMLRQIGEQPFNMRAGVDKSPLSGPLRRGPTGIEAVSGRDRKQSDIPAILRHQTNRLDGLGRDRAGISHHDLAVRPRLA